MRSEEEISQARAAVIRAFSKPGLHPSQKALFAGASAVLQWLQGGGTFIADLIAGRPGVAKTEQEIESISQSAENRLRELLAEGHRL